ncbi:WD repeat-containing protein 86 isoform X1 [Vulpes lagopus]|uniref:WD repeat-containing protein 86 isoform X1 n=1 Tax=Vulpes lagopus TaxID=494514 RepID=UPI001BC9BAC1|nr:WD repeat-containing protein 86 isoform X1 [Vulpes lagopus]
MGGGGSALRVCADHRGGINWLSLSPDGQRLLTGSEDGTARLWSTADGQCCALLQGHESYVTFCQLEDEAAFTCSADCTIRKWDVRTGQCLQVFRGHTSIVNRILVANNQLFSSSYDRTARAWSVDKGQVSQEFRGHRNCVLTLAYSAPWDLPGAPCAEEVGGLLVTGSTDGTAKVWQVASGCCHQTLRGHTGAVLCLVLDTPSHTAFTGSTDATIRAWDILSGEQLRVFREHQGSVICLEEPSSGSVMQIARRPSDGLDPAGAPWACRPLLYLLRHRAGVCECHSGQLGQVGSGGACLQGSSLPTRAALGAGASGPDNSHWVSSSGPSKDLPQTHCSHSARQPARVLGQRRQDGQVLAGRHGRARAHVCGPQTQRERPQIPRRHLVHGQRGRPRARLRRPVWSAAEGVPRPRLRHQLHPGARAGALHGLARWRAAPLGRARPPVRPAAAPRRPRA